MSTVIEDIQFAETIENAVYTALGAASVCWESMEGTGRFDDVKAREIGEALLLRITAQAFTAPEVAA